MMERRPWALEKRDYDLLVIGGGIFGASAAWEAAQRGLSVALVERGDFGEAGSDQPGPQVALPLLSS